MISIASLVVVVVVCFMLGSNAERIRAAGYRKGFADGRDASTFSEKQRR